MENNSNFDSFEKKYMSKNRSSKKEFSFSMQSKRSIGLSMHGKPKNAKKKSFRDNFFLIWNLKILQPRRIIGRLYIIEDKKSGGQGAEVGVGNSEVEEQKVSKVKNREKNTEKVY